MAISKTDCGITAVAGGNITYTIVYTNLGSQDALNVRITETIRHTSYVGYGWNGYGGGQYWRNVGTVLAARRPYTIVVNVSTALPAAWKA